MTTLAVRTLEYEVGVAHGKWMDALGSPNAERLKAEYDAKVDELVLACNAARRYGPAYPTCAPFRFRDEMRDLIRKL